ncbi:TetR/AcrR family transcriptional regulator [Nocardioides okcheonensis]|uniref:TetR/AcrR family transcriptional regulator n=1 Tax=Nocardioides okcheonensis TaxID=2894081 RepID=UPI001E366517|nr:TetR/AcrR family transcriptional regulator [Nocardioides okcheonensis]UFN43986.1 TetR/AcrR family transcriptional regulator [Nocardioides okcheonensis]
MSRPPLTHQRVVEAAGRVADAAGLGGVSMRSVGRELGVEAMSLYHHVASKDALLDGLADWLFAQIATPTAGLPWRAEMETRAHSARRVLAAHPWGLGLIESRRSPGPASLRHHDSVLGCLRTAGFTVALAAHAFSVLDAYTYGFVLTEVNLPFEPGESTEEFLAGIAGALVDHPHLAEMVAEQVSGRDYAYGNEFDHGLALVLDGLEARHDAEVRART